ncbi:MAG: helix-turn-helix transcriptional regulator [Gammaproteobacteria bacterium]|uniref:helix-turn-helix transcriptional regulator n=1 Tax=Xanthomonas boreopolis TaxID=86183 RepID=UPI0032DC742F
MDMALAVDRIAARVYAGVLDDGHWRGGLDAVCEAVGGFCFHRMTMDPLSLDVVESEASFSAPPDKVVEYERHHAGRDLRVRVGLALPIGSPMVDHRDLGMRAIARDPIYVDWLAPIGLRHSMGVVLRKDAEATDLLGLLRERAQPPFEDEACELFQRLAPHLAEASRLRSRARELALQAALGHAALDALPQAVMMIDGQGRVLHANARALACARTGQPFGIRQGRLRFPDAAASDALARGLNRVGAGHATAFRLARPDGWIVASMLPLADGHRLAAGQGRPWALMVMSGMGTSHGPDPRLLRELFALTPSEIRLALCLLSGQTLSDFVASQRCSVETGRTHLKNLLHKSGCHRQADLVRLLHSLG